MKTRLVVIVVGILSCTSVPGVMAQQGEAGHRFGVAVTGAVVGAPLGSVAGSYGLFAVPGLELDARVVARGQDGREWTLGVSGDRYGLDLDRQQTEGWNFEYSSVAAVGGRSWLSTREGPSIRYGLDVGVRHFTATGTRPDAFEGESQTSSAAGTAALIAVSYGVEVPSARFIVSPRFRLETSYPDLGGGDGYSGLHRTSDLGFRASVGLEVKNFYQR